jgi:hypothetical protein
MLPFVATVSAKTQSDLSLPVHVSDCLYCGSQSHVLSQWNRIVSLGNVSKCFHCYGKTGLLMPISRFVLNCKVAECLYCYDNKTLIYMFCIVIYLIIECENPRYVANSIT